MFFCISRTSLASGGHGREDGAAEPALSHKEAMVLLGSDYAYWDYITGSPPLDALLLILRKTLTAVKKKPESHGFIGRRITNQLYFLWVKNPDMFEDAHLLTPISHHDLASAVEESLATFTVYLPLGVFLAQTPRSSKAPSVNSNLCSTRRFVAASLGFSPKHRKSSSGS